MKSHVKNIIVWYVGAVIVASFVFTTCDCKTVNSREFTSQVSPEKKENVFLSVAKSLATQAYSEFKESARRNPRFGMNITFLPQSLTNYTGGFPNITGGNFLETSAQLGLIGLKGGILGIKAAIIQTAVLILFIIFLLTGIAYFACNIGIFSCTNLGGSLGGLGNIGNGQFSSPFSRTGYDYQNLHRLTSSVHNAIDDTQKKYT